MIYVVFIIIAVLLVQIRLAKHPITGLILPLSCAMGAIAAGIILFDPRGRGWQDPQSRLSFLIFLLLTAAAFLLYVRQRRKEYREGYRDDEKSKKGPQDKNIG